jgi:hypothetical protein
MERCAWGTPGSPPTRRARSSGGGSVPAAAHGPHEDCKRPGGSMNHGEKRSETPEPEPPDSDDEDVEEGPD